MPLAELYSRPLNRAITALSPVVAFLSFKIDFEGMFDTLLLNTGKFPFAILVF